MTNRSIDHSAEQAVARYLDAGFYRELSANTQFVITRETSPEKQLAGIDVSMIGTTDDIFIDEKAKFHNLNEQVEQFAFEVESIQNKVVRAGWFVCGNKTTHYFLLDVFAKCMDYSRLTDRNIVCIVGMMVRKSDICDYLQREGVSIGGLILDAKDLRIRYKGGEYNARKYYPTCHLTLSPRLQEKPINLVISRTVLANLPNTKRYYIRGSQTVKLGMPKNPDILEAQFRLLSKRIEQLEKKIGA